MPIENLPIVVPDTAPRIVGVPFHTDNGYYVQVHSPFSITVQHWIEEAFNACGFDIERMWCIRPMWDGDNFASGFPAELTFHVHPVASSGIPNFGDDFTWVDVSLDAQVRAVIFGVIDIYVWDGLASADPPYGGRLFFKETILHAIGHVVGKWLASGDDIFKRKYLMEALCWEKVQPLVAVDGWGYGVAWTMWDGGDTWSEMPIERYAEVFKDVFGLPSARRFLNRTKAPAVDVARVIAETHVYLPVHGFTAPPHPGQFGFEGVSMYQHWVEANTLVTACFDPVGGGVGHPCFDPEDGAMAGCWPCDPRISFGDVQAGKASQCGQSFTYPVERIINFQWGMDFIVPRAPFVQGATIQCGGPRTIALPTRIYDCPGVPNIGAITIAPGRGQLPGRYSWVDGTYFSVQTNIGEQLHADLADDSFFVWGQGGFGYTFQVHPNVQFGTGLGGPGSSNVRVFMSGYAAWDEHTFRAADSFDAFADPYWNAQGYMHTPGYEVRIEAPSVGRWSNPYAELNLEGLDRGGAKVGIAVGSEAVCDDLAPSVASAPAANEPLIVEGG